MSVPFTGKRPRRPETGIKDGFEEMEHEFPHGILRPEKSKLFRCSVTAGNFPLERPKSRVLFTFQPDFPEIVFKVSAQANFTHFCIIFSGCFMDNIYMSLH